MGWSLDRCPMVHTNIEMICTNAAWETLVNSKANLRQSNLKSSQTMEYLRRITWSLSET